MLHGIIYAATTARWERLTAKLEWAEQHIYDLNDRIAGACDDCFSFDGDPESRSRRNYVSRDIETPPWVPLVIGDIVHNLRSTLDYFAYLRAQERFTFPSTMHPKITGRLGRRILEFFSGIVLVAEAPELFCVPILVGASR